MAQCEMRVQAPAETVFDVLCDPAAYAMWVVGSKHIRGVDADWPQPGSRIHHTVGWGPFEDHDVTKVIELQRPHRLRLEARAWPFGTAEVDVTLTSGGDGTTVRILETLLRGPAARFDNPAIQSGLYLRNLWSLRRLGRWAEECHRGKPGHRPEPAA